MGHESAAAVRAPSVPRTGRPQGLLGGRRKKRSSAPCATSAHQAVPARARAASARRSSWLRLSTISELPNLAESTTTTISDKCPPARRDSCPPGQGLTLSAIMGLPALDLATSEVKRGPQPEKCAESACGLTRSPTIVSDDEWADLLLGALFRPVDELCGDVAATGCDAEARWMDTSKKVLLSLLPPAKASEGEAQRAPLGSSTTEKTTTDPIQPKKPEAICSQKRPHFAGRSLSARRLVRSVSLDM